MLGAKYKIRECDISLGDGLNAAAMSTAKVATISALTGAVATAGVTSKLAAKPSSHSARYGASASAGSVLRGNALAALGGANLFQHLGPGAQALAQANPGSRPGNNAGAGCRG